MIMKIGQLISLEQLSGPVPKDNLETEYAIYAKIGDMHGLESCDHKEEQVQVETKFENGTRARMRYTKDFATNKESYVFTFKIDHEDGSVSEYNLPTDKEAFAAFRHIAEYELVKTRYVFHARNISISSQDNTYQVMVPDLKYEVDVYTKTDGSVCEFCKIDMEVDALYAALKEQHSDKGEYKLNIKVSHLPFKPTPIAIGQQADDHQKQIIDGLWKLFRQPLGQGKEQGDDVPREQSADTSGESNSEEGDTENQGDL
jgi:hypothetical protein